MLIHACNGWLVCMQKDVDVPSEGTYQCSHVITMTIFIKLPNTPKTYRPQIIIFPKPLEDKYIFSQFQVLQAVLDNCSHWVRWLPKQLYQTNSLFFSSRLFQMHCQFGEGKSMDDSLVVIFYCAGLQNDDNLRQTSLTRVASVSWCQTFITLLPSTEKHSRYLPFVYSPFHKWY